MDDSSEEVETERAAELMKFKLARKVTRQNTTKYINQLEAMLGNKNTMEEDLCDHLSLLTPKEQALLKYDQQILKLVNDPAEIEKEMTIAEEYQDKITLTRNRAFRRVEQLRNLSTNTTASNCANVNRAETTDGGSGNLGRSTSAAEAKLPTLDVGKFNGDYTEWTTFWSRFSSSVDSNKSIAQVEKFNYLSSFLSGEAKELLTGMHASDANYIEAVNLLKARYDREDLMIHTHMNRLLNLQPVHNADDVKALRQLFNTCNANVRSLKSLGIDTMVSGFSICPAIIKCLPNEIRLNYSLNRQKGADWDINALMQFIERQLEGRETANRLGISVSQPMANREKIQNKMNKTNSKYNESHLASAHALTTGVTTRASVFCIFCNDDSHASMNCSKFDLDEKKGLIRDQNRCFICMKRGHSAKRCLAKNKNCRLCQWRHHVSLCSKNEANSRPNKQNSERAKDQISEAERKTSEEKLTVAILSTSNENSINRSGVVLLQTAKALAKNSESEKYGVEVRCLLDSGSQASFIREEVSRELMLPVVGEEVITIHTFGNAKPKQAKRKRVKLVLQNKWDPTKIIDIIAIEEPYLCEVVTTSNFKEIEGIMKVKGLKMADPPSKENQQKIILI